MAVTFHVVCDHCQKEFFTGGKTAIKQYDKKESDLCKDCEKELATLTKRHDDEKKAFFKV